MHIIANIDCRIIAQNKSKIGHTTVQSAAINLSTALRLCFQYKTTNISKIAAASDNQYSLIIGNRSGKIEKIELFSNTPFWSTVLGGEIVTDLIAEDENLFAVTKVYKKIPPKLNDDRNENGNGNKEYVADQVFSYVLWSLNQKTGITNWQFPFELQGAVNLSSYRDKLFLTAAVGNMIAVSKTDARVIWSKRVASEIESTPVFTERKTFFGTRENSIVIVSSENGALISKIATINPPQIILATEDGRLYWADKKGFLNVSETVSKTRVQTKQFGGEISDLTAVADGILISSSDNFVYLVSSGKIKTLWKRRLDRRVLAKPLITKDFAVFTTSGDDRAVVIDLKNGKPVNQISLAERGFLLSAPLLINNLLVFATSRGVFAFAAGNVQCPVQDNE